MIEIKNLTKIFPIDGKEFKALDNVSFTIDDGDIFGIIGMSGAGKSTLVRCMNMLERPTEGSVIIDGVDMCSLSPAALRKKRRDITMIFQGFNLLMQRTCLANVRFPLELQGGMSKADMNKRALELLETVGLAEKANAYPAMLSGGQQQRVAIARALATNPKVLLCDEATSALDPTTTVQILDLIRDINKKTGITAVIITHQMSVVENICRHVAILDGGTVAEIGEVGTVFANAVSDAAKRLVSPEESSNIRVLSHQGERKLRVVFNGALASGTPLITHMAVEIGIEANILYASTKIIDEKVYGTIILGITGERSKVFEAITYLESTPDIIAEEVKDNA